ncbi:BrxA/BrxB family bacilliredoxin [candidate division KSB1 bacterium]|nr:BrxA/BrxB family bacilliredoxin [candidate division KSB1 bacterium]
MYDPAAVQPMRDELTATGFEELLTSEAVDQTLSAQNNETILLVVNSVCGCAAGSARPGVTLALQHHTIPDRFVTVFAGQDRAAVEHVRGKYLADFPPSSPSMALFKNGKAIYVMHRREIEGRPEGMIANTLAKVFEQHCTRKGPAISPEAYAQLTHALACGSTIPRYAGN